MCIPKTCHGPDHYPVIKIKFHEEPVISFLVFLFTYVWEVAKKESYAFGMGPHKGYPKRYLKVPKSGELESLYPWRLLPQVLSTQNTNTILQTDPLSHKKFEVGQFVFLKAEYFNDIIICVQNIKQNPVTTSKEILLQRSLLKIPKAENQAPDSLRDKGWKPSHFRGKKSCHMLRSLCASPKVSSDYPMSCLSLTEITCSQGCFSWQNSLPPYFPVSKTSAEIMR